MTPYLYASGRAPRGWIVPFLLLLGPQAASAEPVHESGYYETATVRARPLSSATASVTVLDREAIEDLRVPSVAELIRFVPGVDVTPSGPRSGFATAQIRGGDPNYSVILLDGVPLNDINDQFGGAVNLNSLSTAHVERIEVVRGPLSSNLGSAGLAGAINIITRHGAPDSQDVGFAAAAGSDSQGLASAFVSGGGAESDYFVGATWEQEEDRVVEDEFDQGALQARGGLDVGSAGDLRLTGRFADWDAEDYPEASGGPEALCPPSTAECQTRTSQHEEVSLGSEWLIGNGERRHKVYASAYRHDLERQSPAYGPVPAAIEDTTFETWRLGWVTPQLGSGRVQATLGAEVVSEDGESSSDLGFPAGFSIDRVSGAAYGELTAERGNVIWEAGARVDVPEDFDTEVSPRLGVSFRPGGKATRLRASAGRAFKLPSFFALATPVVGNPALVPETALGADAGVEHRFDAAGLAASLTLFFNRFDDLITFVGSSFIHENVPEVESRGAELALDWQPGGGPVSLAATATRQDFEAEPAFEPLTNRPESFGSLRVLWRITDRARWQVDGQWVAESFDFQAATGTAEPTAGYQLYGTSASWRLPGGFEVHARVDNLSDKQYEAHIGFPGPGRSYRVGLQWGPG
jgi:iron complex outermembrane receptor protein/vitamin B12 transporter